MSNSINSTTSTNASNNLIPVALDPARSVVVEACAGSGKTWLLASRIVRLLLAGVAPGNILAITFTRKAAREIEARVVDWLRLLATDSDSNVTQFLAERGIEIGGETRSQIDRNALDDPALDILRKARSLYEQVAGAQPRLAVNTFHGWFLQLVAAAPLSANLSGATLVNSDSRLFDEWWQSFAVELQKDPQSTLSQSFVDLLTEAGLDATRRLVRRGMDRRAEWLAFSAGQVDPLAHVLAELRTRLGVGETESALSDFFTPNWALEFHAYLGWLEKSELATDKELALKLSRALAANTSANTFADTFENLREVFLTQKGTLRARKPSKTLDKRFGVDGALRFLAQHAHLGGKILACLQQQIEERIYRFNQHACRVLQALLGHVEAFKAARRQIDFGDAEWRVLQLLRDKPSAVFLQARLDARYSHVLLDEFQDTNPLQWQILLAWLEAYPDAEQPGVFMVGDPKQSIYRFRRAEPKLFAAASAFLTDNFAADRCELDTTRRNARPIIEVVNALFLGVPEFEPFRAQRSLTGSIPGRVELLPLCCDEEDEKNEAAEGDEANQEAEASAPEPKGLRDPLSEADSEPVDSRRRREAERVASCIRQMVGVWQIEDVDAAGHIKPRALRYNDIMLLTRSRTKLGDYEKALAAADIPFDAASRGGLLATLEARDIVALLEFLVTPVANLQLAQTLRSPIFACTDEELLCLAVGDEPTWWQRLLALRATDGAPPRLARAARLLSDWLSAADRLPAHDLFDRIYHQGEVLERYRLAAPLAARAGVEANLRALLLLSLDLDGGRYPSLPRFIDELRELSAADANDAPDEGAIENAAAAAMLDAGRVRILTIHGAKGLESPIVWLLDANAAPRAAEAWDVLVDWAPEAAAPQHFSFYGRMEDRGAARQPLFEAEAAAAVREELNLLYVAITRARQVFIASGIDSKKNKNNDKDLTKIQQTPYRRLEAALEKLGGSGYRLHGADLPQIAGEALASSPAQAIDEAGVLPTPLATPLPAPWPLVGERRVAPDAAERFGILLHALLERRTGKAALAGWWRDLGFDDDEYQRVLPLAEQLLAAPDLQRFFNPKMFQRAWNELDLAARDGTLRRIDRLVELDDALWVLDYKSSGRETPHLNAYRAQVADYCAAVAAVFPGRPIHGVLVFNDASVLEVS